MNFSKAVLVGVLCSVMQKATATVLPLPADLFRVFDRLAAPMGLEAVYGQRFPAVNPYGSYGSTYVLDFVRDPEFKSSVLFLARRKHPDASSPSSTDAVSLVHNFDYVLIFAVKKNPDDQFVVKDVLDNGFGLMGMSLYYGEIGLTAKEFRYLDSGNNISGQELDRRKLSTPIVISGEASTTILLRYGNRWLEHVERDW